MTEFEIKQKTELEKQNEMLLEKVAELESYLLQKNIAIEELKDAKAQMAQISYNVQVENNKLKKQIPVWHDLREDPTDLPEDTYDVLDQAGYKVHYNFFQNVWVNEKDEIDNHVIAWCEVPVFGEEHNA